MSNRLIAGIALAVLAWPAAAALAATATFTYAEGVNDQGQVTGFYDTGVGITTAGFVESNGVYTSIAVPGALETMPYGISDTGVIAGQFFKPITGNGNFIYDNGVFTFYDDPIAPALTFGYGISSNGTVAGYYYGGVNNTFHGFEDSSGHFTTVDDPAANGGTLVFAANDNGATTGYYFNNGVRTAFLEVSGSFADLADPAALPMETYPTGINNSDEVVGYFGDATGAHGFADVGGVFTTIDDPLAIPGTTYAQGVNNSGAITGYFSMGQSVYGFLDVNGVFTTINDPDAVPLPALPEPGLWMLMLAGNGLIASALRRRRAGSARSPSRG